MELSEPEFDTYLETIKESMYQYLLLIAVSKSETASDNGIKIGDDTISVDLRSTLPSTFLRPHAQHGWTIKESRLIVNMAWTWRIMLSEFKNSSVRCL